jgi:hypothetical protein
MVYGCRNAGNISGNTMRVALTGNTADNLKNLYCAGQTLYNENPAVEHRRVPWEYFNIYYGG